LQKNFLT
jgi:aldehyde dehydrogenase (NAD+)